MDPDVCDELFDGIDMCVRAIETVAGETCRGERTYSTVHVAISHRRRRGSDCARSLEISISLGVFLFAVFDFSLLQPDRIIMTTLYTMHAHLFSDSLYSRGLHWPTVSALILHILGRNQLLVAVEPIEHGDAAMGEDGKEECPDRDDVQVRRARLQFLLFWR